MDVPLAFLNQPLLTASWLIAALVLLFTMIKLPWARLREGDSTNVLFGAIVFLIVLWGIKAGVSPQQNLHFLGVTTLYLMFGWQYALLAGLVLLLVTTARFGLGWPAVGFNFVMMVCLPVLVTHILLKFAQRFLPLNFFIYIFLNAFLAAALGFYLSGYLIHLLIGGSVAAEGFPLVNEYPLFLLLLAIPEGGLNGMVMTATVVYRPQWVATFHDRMYLYRQ